MKRILLHISILLLLSPVCLRAQEASDIIVFHSDSAAVALSAAPKAPQQPRSGLARWWNSLINGNIDRTFERPFDFTFAVAPFYSADTGVSFVAQLSALYRVDRTDSLLQVSNLSLSAGASWNGTYNVNLMGDHHINRNQRLSYRVEFRRQVRDFWGINYDDCNVNTATTSRNLLLNLSADYQQRIAASGWFWGASMRMFYNQATVDQPAYLLGQDPKGFFAGFGPLIQYDTRDYSLNPKRGLYFFYRNVIYPNVISTNAHWLVKTTAQFSAYHSAWKGSTFAYDVFFQGSASRGQILWQMREISCEDDRRMRGCQAGRYIDNNQLSAQFEIRQNVWKRLGVVAWGGCGTFYNSLSDISGSRILPTYGAGIRFEFKHNTNIRVDYGRTRNESVIIFNFGEAF
ncbi:MAG: hypothetical protein KBT12_06020 [Bacteroidales bacterium]|nr:hypothetical protein [Candidatus Physcousia equi]